MDYILIILILVIAINKEIINKLTKRPLVGLLVFTFLISTYIIFESLKYQMIFVYIYFLLMTSLFTFLAFLNINNKKYRIQKDIFKKISYIVFIISLLFVIALPLDLYFLDLGDFDIGTETYQLKNVKRNFQNKDYRKLKLRFFYPIDSKSDQKDNLFIDNKPVEKIFEKKFSKKIFSYLNDLKIDAFLNTDITSKKDKIKPIIISHKKDFLSEDYITISKTLASKGYFVIAVNHIFYSEYSFLEGNDIFSSKYTSDANNILQNYKRDILDTISFLKQINKKYSYKIDLNNIILLGHGVGGQASLDIAIDDYRVKKVICIESKYLENKKIINKDLKLLSFNSKNNLDIENESYEYNNINSEMFTSRNFLDPFSYINYVLGINKLSKIHKLEIDFIKKY